MLSISPWTAVWQYVAPQAFAPAAGDRQVVARVAERWHDFRALSDTALHCEADALREQVAAGAELTSPAIVAPALALAAEALRRELGVELYDVQLLAGWLLTQGRVVELATGEGKTFAAALAAFAWSLAGDGVHVATPNAYLAERDHVQLASVFHRLGTWAALLPEQGLDDANRAADAKRTAYAADITYGSGYEFGFDYLRDQLAAAAAADSLPLGARQQALLEGRALPVARPLQRTPAAAIIDEIDAVLIDEASLPLILSSRPAGPPPDAELYVAAQVAVTRLSASDFAIDERARTVQLTRAGEDRAAKLRPTAGRDWQRAWSEYVRQAIVANRILKRDVDYVVRDERLWLVDQSTGRVFADRSWQAGLQQAVEVKEGLRVSHEMQVAARVARQRYFRRYARLSGMTGTTTGSAGEFWRNYQLAIVCVPRRLPLARNDWPTRVFANSAAKARAIVAEVRRLHAAGRPVLLGTRTISESEALAHQLADVGIAGRLLNGKQTADEAAIIAAAGQRGAVTIATNMAGRGTDIRLGPGVAALGGLHVLSSQRHLSARIDAQLAGRAGRQGDAGSSQFFVSSDDELVTRFAPELADVWLALADGLGEVHSSFEAELRAAQERAEAQARATRRALAASELWYDEFLARASGAVDSAH